MENDRSNNFIPLSGKTDYCPVCNKYSALEEDFDKIKTWLCINCGYTSNSTWKKNSKEFRQVINTSPKLIIGFREYDNIRFIWWIPTVINMPSKGILFPEGTKTNIIWVYAPIEIIPENERINFPIPNSQNKYYENRINPNNAKRFTRFYDALIEMGAILPEEDFMSEKPRETQ